MTQWFALLDQFDFKEVKRLIEGAKSIDWGNLFQETDLYVAERPETATDNPQRVEVDYTTAKALRKAGWLLVSKQPIVKITWTGPFPGVPTGTPVVFHVPVRHPITCLEDVPGGV